MEKQDFADKLKAIKAVEKGEKIEFYLNGVWQKAHDDFDKEKLLEIIAAYNVRVEPKKRVSPYRTAKEFVSAMKEHGPFITWPNDTGFYATPITINNNRIFFTTFSSDLKNTAIVSYGFENLSGCKWQDGTPVGVVVSEYDDGYSEF